MRAERISFKKREKDLETTIDYLKKSLKSENQKLLKVKEDQNNLMLRYQTETSAKISKLEEAIRLQDESGAIAIEARNQIREDIQSKFDKQLRALLTVSVLF